MSNNSTEAAKSATVKCISPNGFHWMCTVRGDDKSSLMEDMEAFERVATYKGWKPEAPQTYNKFVPKEKEYLKDEVCPKCGGRLISATTKTGKKFAKCEKNRWNFQTRQAEGCDYVKWNEMTQEDL